MSDDLDALKTANLVALIETLDFLIPQARDKEREVLVHARMSLLEKGWDGLDDIVVELAGHQETSSTFDDVLVSFQHVRQRIKEIEAGDNDGSH